MVTSVFALSLFFVGGPMGDDCPSDPSKVTPGVCGCGVAENIADDDGDGQVNCLDDCPTDFMNDADDDGLCAGREDDLGTDPSDADTDADGISDGAETTLRGSGLCPSPLMPDSDNDGVNDGAERNAHTDPCQATAPPMPPPGKSCGGCGDDGSTVGFGLIALSRFRRRRA